MHLLCLLRPSPRRPCSACPWRSAVIVQRCALYHYHAFSLSYALFVCVLRMLLSSSSAERLISMSVSPTYTVPIHRHFGSYSFLCVLGAFIHHGGVRQFRGCGGADVRDMLGGLGPQRPRKRGLAALLLVQVSRRLLADLQGGSQDRGGGVQVPEVQSAGGDRGKRIDNDADARAARCAASTYRR